jgi:hypothetical protein
MDRRMRIVVVYIVTTKNMATVWATSGHFTPPLVRFAGLNNAAMHRKNRAMTMPKTAHHVNLVRP